MPRRNRRPDRRTSRQFDALDRLNQQRAVLANNLAAFPFHLHAETWRAVLATKEREIANLKRKLGIG